MQNKNDKQGKAWAHESTCKACDLVRCDGGFTCIPDGAVRVVHEDHNGLYIACEDGKHYLSGQLADDGCGAFVGLYPATAQDVQQHETYEALKADISRILPHLDGTSLQVVHAYMTDKLAVTHAQT